MGGQVTEERRRSGMLKVPHPVVDLEAYRLAKKVFWLSVFYDRNIPFEDVYEGVLVLLDRYEEEAKGPTDTKNSPSNLDD
jgi:hypothetical protein